MSVSSLFPVENDDDRGLGGNHDESAGAASPALRGRTQSLYRRYRPQTFEGDDLVGQEHVVRTLRNAILLDRIAHAYLFCGPHGTGKTTTARLLAKAVNCLEPDAGKRPCNQCASCIAINNWSTTDVIEIDAASNRGIDDIRELRERVKFAPTQLRTKFYIIDEAHQITGPAANAFLKTLEEPPPHTKFVLATTDPEELLTTIVSRCQRFDFRRIPAEKIVARLNTVATAEGIELEPDAAAVIARHAAGSLRDALGLFDQLSVYIDADVTNTPGRITTESVRELLGISHNEHIELIVRALADRDPGAALEAVNAAVDRGDDPRQINRQLVQYLRLLLHERAGGSADADDTARELAASFQLPELARIAKLFGDIDFRIKRSTLPQLPLEIALVEATLLPATASSAVAPQRDTPRATAPPVQDTGRDTSYPPPPAPERNLQPVRETPPAPAAATEAPDRPSNAEAASSPPPVSRPAAPAANADASLTIDQVADLWSQVRFEVKARNRRVEALLSSVDPAVVSGDRIILAAAYPFHRDKLNSEDAKAIVEEVMSRVLQRPVTIETVLRGEEPSITKKSNGAARTAATTPGAPPVGAVEHASNAASASAIDSELQRRVTAAKNIFDAEEIDP